MKKVTRYVSQDGKMFDSEEECVAYELSQPGKSELHLWDAGCLRTDLINAEYLKCDTPQAFDYLQTLCELEDVLFPFDDEFLVKCTDDIYHYNEDCIWESKADELKNILILCDKLGLSHEKLYEEAKRRCSE